MPIRVGCERTGQSMPIKVGCGRTNADVCYL